MEKLEDSGSRVPIDRGWAWVVLVGCTGLCAIQCGVVVSFGIVYVEFLELFGEGQSATAVMSSVYSLCFAVSSPVAALLCQRCSIRASILVAGVTAAAGWIGTSLAQSLLVAIITYGAVGVSDGFMYGPTYVILAQYFKERRSLANGVAAAGASLGFFIFPPAIRFFIDTFGLRGCLLILAGVKLNYCVLGVLLRPIEFWGKGTNRTDDKSSIATAQSNSQTGNNESCNGTEKDNGIKQVIDAKPRTEKLNVVKTCDARFWTSAPVYKEPGDIRDGGSVSPIHVDKNNKDQSMEGTPSESVHGKHIPFGFDLNRTKSISYAYLGEITNTNLLHKKHGNMTKYLPHNKQFEFGSNADMNFSISIMSLNSMHVKDDSKKDASTLSSKMSKTKFDFRCMKNPLFWVYVVSFAANIGGYGFALFFFPPYTNEVGLDKSITSTLLSAGGGIQLFSRLVIGFVSDRQYISPSTLVRICSVMAGIFTIALPFLPYLEFIVAFVVVLSMFGGSFFSVAIVILAEYVGLDQLASANSIYLLVSSCFHCALPVVLAQLCEATGTFAAGMFAAGGLYALGTAALIIEPLARKFNTWRESRDMKREAALLGQSLIKSTAPPEKRKP